MRGMGERGIKDRLGRGLKVKGTGGFSTKSVDNSGPSGGAVNRDAGLRGAVESRGKWPAGRGARLRGFPRSALVGARSIAGPSLASSSASRWAYWSGGNDRRSRAMRRSASRPARVKRAKGRRPGGSTTSIKPRASSVRIAVRSSLGWPWRGPAAQRCSQIPSSSGYVCPPRARNAARIGRRSAAVNGARPRGVEVRARGTIGGGRLARRGPATLLEGSGGRRRSPRTGRDRPRRRRRYGQFRVVFRHQPRLEGGAAQVRARPGGMVAKGGHQARAQAKTQAFGRVRDLAAGPRPARPAEPGWNAQLPIPVPRRSGPSRPRRRPTPAAAAARRRRARSRCRRRGRSPHRTATPPAAAGGRPAGPRGSPPAPSGWPAPTGVRRRAATGESSRRNSP